MPVCSKALERAPCGRCPAERFDMSQWSRARVNIDYHIAFEGNFYSVPYTLVQERVEVRSTPTTVEIFHKGQRVASHLRGRGTRPSHHAERAPTEESPGASGVDTLAHGEVGRADRAAHGTAVRAHPGREAASGDGLSIVSGDHPARRTVLGCPDGSRSGSSVAGQRCLPLPEREIDPEELARPATTRTNRRLLPPPPPHDNIRGAGYFSEEGERMLQQPMIEKLQCSPTSRDDRSDSNGRNKTRRRGS